MMRVLGVDPGMAGALACYEDSLGALSVHDMPLFSQNWGRGFDKLNQIQLHELISSFAPDCAFCERVGAMPGQGVVSMFTFGVAFGTIRGILASLRIPVRYLTPQQWQRTMGVPHGKDAARRRATELLPNYAPLFARVRDDGRADATLIALAGLRLGA